MITVQQEPWFDIRHLVRPLWEVHHAEIARDGHAIPLAPDWRRYDDLAMAGKLLIVTVRKDAELAGYAFAVIDTHLHYATSLMGFFDIYWLDPRLRRSMAGTGIKLLRKTEELGNRRGVKKWFIGSKLWQDHSSLFERMGWTETERLFSKLAPQDKTP